jgi:nucleotide-binding universal stress UspA family protein
MVVGTQRKLGLRDVLLGSTAREVIKSSPAPVIVVRTHEDAKPDER